MDATLTKTQRVLHLVQPTEYGGSRMTFTEERDGNIQHPGGIALQMDWALWTELGRPDDLTVTLRPDDTLN